MLSAIHLLLMKVDWESFISELITRLSILARRFEIIFQEELMRLMGRKSLMPLGEVNLAMTAKLTQLSLSRLALPSKKSLERAI